MRKPELGQATKGNKKKVYNAEVFTALTLHAVKKVEILLKIYFVHQSGHKWTAQFLEFVTILSQIGALGQIRDKKCAVKSKYYPIKSNQKSRKPLSVLTLIILFLRLIDCAIFRYKIFRILCSIYRYLHLFFR